MTTSWGARLMKLSRFATKFTSRSGILSLMDDMGAAMAAGDMLMLGGGNPGRIPEVETLFRQRMQRILETPDEFERLIGNYGPPAGDKTFRESLASLLRKTYGWDISAQNIALTNGSQSAFFMLFNVFAGECPDASLRKILLPITQSTSATRTLGSATICSYRPGPSSSISTSTASNTGWISTH